MPPDLQESRRFSSYREFWPFYMAEHSRARTRALHFLGTALALLCLTLAVIETDPRWLVGTLLCGYGFAWIGHAFVERNRPATFRHPFWSLASDLRMFALWISGRLEGEIARLGITEQGRLGQTGPKPPR